jgi:hypothetical protein
MLQADLNAVRNHVAQGSAYEPLVADGIFGSKTHNRVLEFQRINGLTADGIAGPQTIGKLQELLLSQPGLQTQQTSGGVAPGSTQTNKEIGKPVPATTQTFGKMPAGGGSGQVKGGVGGTSQPYGGTGKVTSGGARLWGGKSG